MAPDPKPSRSIGANLTDLLRARTACVTMRRVGGGPYDPAMIIHRSPLPDVEIPDVPVTEYVLRVADTFPDRPALIDGPSGRTYTFAQLRDMVHRFAGGLAGARVRAGPHAGARWRPTCPSTRSCSTASPSPAARSPRSTRPTAPRRCGSSCSTPVPRCSSRSGMFAETAKAAIEGTPITEVLTLDHATRHGQRARPARRADRAGARRRRTTTSSCSPTRRAPPGCRRA